MQRTGFQHFLLVADYSISQTPWRHATALTDQEADRFNAFAASALILLDRLAASHSAHLLILDCFNLIPRIYADPRAYGFDATAGELRDTSILAGAYAGGERVVQKGPSRWFWTDEFHPSERGHQIIAECVSLFNS